MNLQNMVLKPAASASSNTVNTAVAPQESRGSTDFRALFSSKLRQLEQNFAETGLTPADQALYAAGGQAVLEAKEYLQKNGSALVTDSDELRKKALEKSEELAGAAKMTELETFRKHMPDGSIMLLTYENGKLVETEKRKPHLVAKADYSRPAKIVNDMEKPQIKLVPRMNLLEDL